jgi:hypothetical protein
MVDLQGATAVGYLARSRGLHPDTASSAGYSSSLLSCLLFLSIEPTHKIEMRRRPTGDDRLLELLSIQLKQILVV